MLPPFDTRGNLPPGIHHASWEEMVKRFGCSPRRQWLLKGLRKAVRDLRRAGCNVVYIDGSFVTSKESPGDYDACYELSDIDLVKLRLFAPVFFDFANGRAAQKAKYRGEWFPAEMAEGLTRRKFVEFFQRNKNDGEAKGIIAVDIRSLP